MNLRAIVRKATDVRGNRALRHGLVAGLAVFLLLVGSGASYAYWRATAAASGNAGTATVRLTADDTAAAPLSSAHRLGKPKTAPVTILNAGDVALVYTASVAPTAGWTLPPSSVQVYVWNVASAADCTDAAVIGPGAWSGTLAGFTVAPTATLGPGVSQVLCVRTALASTVTQAQQGQTVAATIIFTGSNGWQSSASVAVSPSVYTVSSPQALPGTNLCAPENANSNKKLIFTWQAVPNASGYRLYFSPALPVPPAAPYVSVTGTTTIISGDNFDTVTGSQQGSGTVSIRAVVDGWESAALATTVYFAANSTGSNAKLSCTPF